MGLGQEGSLNQSISNSNCQIIGLFLSLMTDPPSFNIIFCISDKNILTLMVWYNVVLRTPACDKVRHFVCHRSLTDKNAQKHQTFTDYMEITL